MAGNKFNFSQCNSQVFGGAKLTAIKFVKYADLADKKVFAQVCTVN